MEWGFNSPLAHDETADPFRICGFCFPWLWLRCRRSCFLVLLVAPRVFWAPEGSAAVCAGGRRPAREPSALRASLGASSRSPARPRRRPPAPRQIPPVPFTPVGPGRGRVPQLCASKPGQASPPPINFARNSPATCSNIEFISSELQRFWGVSKNDRDKLRAKCGWRWCRRCPWVSQSGPAAPSGCHRGLVCLVFGVLWCVLLQTSSIQGVFRVDFCPVVTNVVNSTAFSLIMVVFGLRLTTFVTGVLARRFELRWFDDVCNVGRPLAARPGSAAAHGRCGQALSARPPGCLKPPSPLRVRNGLFWCSFRVQR